MSRDDYVQQGKQFANDLRDTASKKVADNEESILGAVGKAARWVDQKTGGKYADRIGKAEAKVGEGVGRVAKQGTGEPKAPGAAAGDGTEPVTPPSGTRPAGTQPPGKHHADRDPGRDPAARGGGARGPRSRDDGPRPDRARDRARRPAHAGCHRADDRADAPHAPAARRRRRLAAPAAVVRPLRSTGAAHG